VVPRLDPYAFRYRDPLPHTDQYVLKFREIRQQAGLIGLWERHFDIK